ncbi:GNAT family N-acetyltransferase [Vallicoccus soli]|uniref:GNAT family N-acetyltransferase n=1 Tax=Vallicoccus soli TaxID=2339232 RepID=A0A3A3YWW7_9ACTN|nr:GNAT family N-acetyltransferase [Vallicoccus soli]RJK96098.1 GNAT family N-acetyltransferase [Vallicoccus soli]
MSAATTPAPAPAAAPLDVALDPPLDAALEDALLACWVDVSNAGGAVGFVPPVTADDVRPTAAKVLGRLSARGGPDHLLVARDGAGAVAGWLVLEDREHRLTGHWRTLKRVQVHPSRQGTGVGGLLLRAAEDAARTLGLEALHLTVRGGTGTEAFYARHGYVEVGRVPRALRVAAGDDRDEVYMVRSL